VFASAGSFALAIDITDGGRKFIPLLVTQERGETILDVTFEAWSEVRKIPATVHAPRNMLDKDHRDAAAIT
jgi:hypothetical protein